MVLPAQYRRDLRAVYDVVRVIDDLGDLAAGDRTALLTDYRADLALLWSHGEPAHSTQRPMEPTCLALAPVVERRRLIWQPFDDLVEANLMDQRVSTYRTFDDVLQYCALSAAPIGRMVLQVFGQSSPEREVLSDRICMALQLLEHWQDVGEDHRAGRTYLPQEDLARFGVAAADLMSATTSPALRRLVRHETDRAAELLESGAPLVGTLHGWARLAVAGYLAGGRATVDALRRADGAVLEGPPKPRRPDTLRYLVRELGKVSR
jgi:squalene synthase HpnC